MLGPCIVQTPGPNGASASCLFCSVQVLPSPLPVLLAGCDCSLLTGLLILLLLRSFLLDVLNVFVLPS